MGIQIGKRHNLSIGGSSGRRWERRLKIALGDGNTVAFYDYEDVSSMVKNESNVISDLNDSRGSGDKLSGVGATLVNTSLPPSNGISFAHGSNAYLTGQFVYNQPAMIYIVVQTRNWTDIRRIFDGGVNGTYLTQTTKEPYIAVSAGALSELKILPRFTYVIIRVLLNGNNSKFIINDGTPVVGNFGAVNPQGFSLGRSATGYSYSDIQVKKVILRKKIEDPLVESEIYTCLRNTCKLKATPFDNGKLVITFDDSVTSLYSSAYPLLINQGVAATFYLTDYWLNGTGGKLTWANAIEMYEGGMDMQDHLYTHADITTLAIPDIIAGMQNTDNLFLAHGLPKPNHVAYPGGTTNDNINYAISALRKTGRLSASSMSYITPDTNKYYIRCFPVDNISDLTNLKSIMDTSKANKFATIINAHGVSVSGGTYEVSEAKLNEIIDYAQSIGLDVITMSQMYDLM